MRGRSPSRYWSLEKKGVGIFHNHIPSLLIKAVQQFSGVPATWEPGQQQKKMFLLQGMCSINISVTPSSGSHGNLKKQKQPGDD